MKPPESSDPRRRAELAKIHIAKQRLGLDDDLYRAVIARVCNGKRSAADLDADERARLLDHFGRPPAERSCAQRAHTLGELASRANESARCVPKIESASCVQTLAEPQAERAGESASCVQTLKVGEQPLKNLPAGRQIAKIRALWSVLVKAGVQRDSSATALRKFVKRQTGQDALEWLTADGANKVIEGLKARLARAAKPEML